MKRSLLCLLALLLSCSKRGSLEGGNARATSITPAGIESLRREIPPPPADAVLVRPRYALRNGP